MIKSRLSFLTIAIVIAAILIAGCTTSNQTSQGPSQTANASTSSTSSSTSTATSSSVASASPTVSPSPSASASPTATSTPAPSGSAKIATSIQFASVPIVSKSDPSQKFLGINVIASGIRICGHGTVTATIGTVSSGGSDCYSTAYLDTSSLNPGTYTVTLSYAGDSTYQPSQSPQIQIQVNA
jgi:hypothetical protein